MAARTPRLFAAGEGLGHCEAAACMRGAVELLRAELLRSMLGRSDGDRWWDHMHRRWKFRQLLEKSFPKQELPSGPEKSVMIYASSWLWPSYSLASPANPPRGPQGRPWVGRESSLRSGGGITLIKRLVVLGSVICGQAARFVPSLHKGS